MEETESDEVSEKDLEVTIELQKLVELIVNSYATTYYRRIKIFNNVAIGAYVSLLSHVKKEKRREMIDDLCDAMKDTLNYGFDKIEAEDEESI